MWQGTIASNVYSVDAIRLSVARLRLRSSVAICVSLTEEGDQLICGPIECASLVINARLYWREQNPNVMSGAI
jgi:hypothetical protein